MPKHRGFDKRAATILLIAIGILASFALLAGRISGAIESAKALGIAMVGNEGWWSLTQRADQPLIFILFTGGISVIAWRVARRMEKTRVGLDLLAELTSERMLQARFNALHLIHSYGDPAAGMNLFSHGVWAAMVGRTNFHWTPGCDRNMFWCAPDGTQQERSPPVETFETFQQRQAVFTIVLYAARVEICRRERLITPRLYKAIVDSFLVHYLPFLDSFASAVRLVRADSDPDQRLRAEWIDALNHLVDEICVRLGRDRLEPVRLQLPMHPPKSPIVPSRGASPSRLKESA